jgi:hypothetical protein
VHSLLLIIHLSELVFCLPVIFNVVLAINDKLTLPVHQICQHVIGLLTQAFSLGISRIIVYLDSQLVVYQLNHIYAIHSPILLRLHLQVCRLERMFDYIEYRHILRELNSVSDSLVNYIMDRYLAHI